jgi:hypothetical protein
MVGGLAVKLLITGRAVEPIVTVAEAVTVPELLVAVRV